MPKVGTGHLRFGCFVYSRLLAARIVGSLCGNNGGSEARQCFHAGKVTRSPGSGQSGQALETDTC